MSSTFWDGRRVLLTGHTGFKGSWLALWLERLGARVTGLSLPIGTEPSLFSVMSPWTSLESRHGDIREPEPVAAAVAASEPEIVFHLAAQSLVRRSYADPLETFSTNTMGTAHVLEAVRRAPSVRVVLVITSDKVYDQTRASAAFVEGDRLGGRDPYSASKAVQELVTRSYAESFFHQGDPRIATCRAGNVIGGGDWAADRLIPDYFRSLASGQALLVRHPQATRPWQHVFDPLRGYLLFAEHLHRGEDAPPALNFGPAGPGASVADVLAGLAAHSGLASHWTHCGTDEWPEHAELSIDSSAAEKWLAWRPQLDFDAALELTAAWYRAHASGVDMRRFSIAQLDTYLDART